ncbi:MAG: ABC transporter substrate-binding protein [Leptolyngbya sp. DLM2.Bin27]|nr:MAG: ABC transporter substrate-binding protein [Leptolyngbya sp. DLM2.Bin27]
MVISAVAKSLNDWGSLSCTSPSLMLPGQPCHTCGIVHFSSDHSQFMESMPQDPVDMVDDLVKMGLYKENQLRAADTVNAYELRKALFLKRVGRNDPRREKLILALCKQAGGLENAFAAAFGPQSGLFFADSVRNSGATRREFLRNMAVGAALVTLASCAGNGGPATEDAADVPVDASALEKTDIQVGFIPITCATPIIMSEPLGFYERYGFNATTVRMPSWGAVRDSAIAGELDAYHMLAPMPIAMTLGLGSPTFGVRLASIQNINGQAITIAERHRGNVNGPEDFRGFVIGVPFPYSMHNLLIRYYLATGGLNPDTDVQIRPVPPPDSIAQLIAGDIDAMLMPDPFNQRAVFEEAGFIYMLTKDLWDGHPCCAFTASDNWIEAHPNSFRALNGAIIEAAGYARDPANRPEIAAAISGRAYLNQPQEVVEAVLTGNFEDGLGNTQSVPDRIDFDPYPWQSFAKWISSQLLRWDLQGDGRAAELITADTFESIGEEIFLTDLARELAQELGQNPPTETSRQEQLAFDTFDPSDPEAYVQAQIDTFGV